MHFGQFLLANRNGFALFQDKAFILNFHLFDQGRKYFLLKFPFLKIHPTHMFYDLWNYLFIYHIIMWDLVREVFLGRLVLFLWKFPNKLKANYSEQNLWTFLGRIKRNYFSFHFRFLRCIKLWCICRSSFILKTNDGDERRLKWGAWAI